MNFNNCKPWILFSYKKLTKLWFEFIHQIGKLKFVFHIHSVEEDEELSSSSSDDDSEEELEDEELDDESEEDVSDPDDDDCFRFLDFCS